MRRRGKTDRVEQLRHARRLDQHPPAGVEQPDVDLRVLAALELLLRLLPHGHQIAGPLGQQVPQDAHLVGHLVVVLAVQAAGQHPVQEADRGHDQDEGGPGVPRGQPGGERPRRLRGGAGGVSGGLRGHSRHRGPCGSACASNGSSTFARSRRTGTSTTLVSLSKFMSHTCSAISVRDSTSPAGGPAGSSRANSFAVRSSRCPAAARPVADQVDLQVGRRVIVSGCAAPGRGAAARGRGPAVRRRRTASPGSRRPRVPAPSRGRRRRRVRSGTAPASAVGPARKAASTAQPSRPGSITSRRTRS